MSYIIRKAEITDAEPVAKLHVETWRLHYKGQVPDEYLDSLSVEKRTQVWREIFSNTKATSFVAEEFGHICGFCSVGLSRDDGATGDTGELYSLYVDEKEQDKGIGSDLMKTGLEYLRETGCKTATLWILKTNTESIGFYLAHGWKADGVEMREVKQGFTFEEVRYGVNL